MTVTKKLTRKDSAISGKMDVCESSHVRAENRQESISNKCHVETEAADDEGTHKIIETLIVLGEIRHGQRKHGVELAPLQLMAFAHDYGCFRDPQETVLVIKPIDKPIVDDQEVTFDTEFTKSDDQVKALDLIKWSCSRPPGGTRKVSIFNKIEVDQVFAAKVVGPSNKMLHEEIWLAGLNAIRGGLCPKILTLGGDHSLAIGSVSACAMLAAKLISLNAPLNCLSNENDECGVSQDSNQVSTEFPTPPSEDKVLWEITNRALSIPFTCPELVVFWIDAHADTNTPVLSTSGSIHGCPVSLLANINTDDWEGVREHFSWFGDKLERFKRITSTDNFFVMPQNIVYIGLRDVDPAEDIIIEEHSILAYRMNEIDSRGGDLVSIVREALAKVDPEGTRPIHCSFDIDSLDPEFAASTGTPVPGGLTLQQGVDIMMTLKQTGRLFSMDLVEVNTLLGTEEQVLQTLDAAARLISVFA